MDEATWLTTYHLADLLEHYDQRSQWGHAQAPGFCWERLKRWVEACREKLPLARGPDTHSLATGGIVRSDAQVWACRSGDTRTWKIRADLFRDVFGNPWRKVNLPFLFEQCRTCKGTGRVAIPNTFICGNPVLQKCFDCHGIGNRCRGCPWLTPDVRGLAEAASESPDHGIMAILADALEEAGCDSEILLWHLRGLEPCRWCMLGSHGSEQACGGRGYGRHKDGRLHGLMKLECDHVPGCWALYALMGEN